ncbi:MAG: VOC family protein [Rhizobacter sp.]|nr:VOC family protein [Bacteriovorax sp.]
MELFELSPAIPQLVTGDIEETAVFFTQSLGFKIITQMKEHKFLSMRRGPAEIHFWQADNRDDAKEIGSTSSCYIRVKNISALFEELKSRETKFRYELQKMPWGMMEMQIDDPFGNAIRFGEVIN